MSRVNSLLFMVTRVASIVDGGQYNFSSPPCQWSPTGKARGPLSDAHVGRHPGHTMAHSSMAKGRGLLLPGRNPFLLVLQIYLTFC